MFKNSKMLKGIVLALAFVLVLGAGVLLNLNANAEGNTVVYYVSDSGNNTTGKDAATAFRTFEAATEAANKLNLAPGTELKFLVDKQVYIRTRELDANTVRDSAGNKVHITITSADPDNKATILHYAYSSSGSTSYEKIFIANDITFKNMIISGEVQSYYQSNAPVTSSGLDYGKFYRTRNIHIGSNTVVFDNCEITSTFPEKSAAKTWVLFCDAYAKSEEEGSSHLKLINGDYSNCTVYVQDQITPLWDLSLYVENASTSTVYALADTDTATTTNAKSVTCYFKDATVGSYNPQGRGHIGVTNGVTAIFEGDTVIKNWVGAMSSTSSLACLDGDLTYIFRDNVKISVTSVDVHSKKSDGTGNKFMYLTPHGTMNGDLHVIVEGGTFNNRLVTGSDTNTQGKATATLNGSITNEFKGGYLKAGLACGLGEAGGTVTGSITNNFYDGFTLGGATSYLGCRGGVSGTTTNNFYGGTFEKIEIYFGGGNGLANVGKNIIKGDLVNNVYGGTFAGTAWVGPHSQTVTGGVYNTFMGGTFSTTFVAGGIGLVTPEMYNVFKDGPDGTYATLKGTTCLGVRGKNSSGPDLQSLDRLYNIFEGNVTFSGTLYCAGGSQSGGKTINDLVQNDFNGGTFNGKVYCGPRYAKDDLSTCDIVNNFNGGAFTTNVLCGGLAGTVRSITNNFHKVTSLGATVYGAGEGGYNGDVVNNLYTGMNFTREFYPAGISSTSNSITNNYLGATFSGNAWRVYAGGTKANSVCGDITNNYYEGTFDFVVNGGGLRGTADSVTNNYYGATFNKYLYGVSTFDSGKDYVFEVKGDVTNNYYGGIFKSQVVGAGGLTSDGLLTNNFYGGTFKYFVYAISNSRAGGGYNPVLDEDGKQIYVNESGDQVFLNGPALSIDSKNNLYYTENSKTKYVHWHDNGYLTYDDGAKPVFVDANGNPVKGSAVHGAYKLLQNFNHMDAVNNIYGGVFEAWFCGGAATSELHNITNNIYGGYFAATHKEALHSEAGRASFYGGDYGTTFATASSSLNVINSAGKTVKKTIGTYYGLNAATTAVSERVTEKTASVTNNIYGGIFDQRVYLGGRIGNIGKINSVIAGGSFYGDRLQPGLFQHSASNKATITLDIKPDESDEILYFACRKTPYGTDGAKVYYSAGLECLNSRTTDTVNLYGAQKPIYIAGSSFLHFDNILGEVTFIQTENWVNGQQYVTVPTIESTDFIKFVNVDASITGSATITTQSVEVEPDSTLRDRVVLVGSATATAPEAVTLPGLEAVNFVLDNNLYVNFYVNKATLENYIAKAGSFTYSVSLDGNVISSGTIASIDEAEVVGEYVKIRSNFAVEAFNYKAALDITFAGNTASYSVYELLAICADNSASNPVLANLLKSIYNYGVEAETLRFGTASATAYEGVTYTGDYSGKAKVTTQNDGYNFVGTGLSLGKDVSLNFYMKAESLEGVTFAAANANGELDASRITVTPFAGNSQYNVVITLKLDIASMGEVVTLTANNAEGDEIATCSTSVAYGCMTYINQNGEFAPIAKALLTYVEKAVEYKNS